MRPEEVLAVAAERLVAPGDAVWRDDEHYRLGYAIALTLTRDELTEQTSVGWLDAVAEDWAKGTPGPPPGEVSNAVHVVRMVYVLANTGVRPSGAKVPVRVGHEAVVRGRVLEVLHSMSSYMW